VFKAAVEVSRPLSRCSRPLSKCPGRCRSVEAAVEVLKPPSRCSEAAVEVWRLLSRC
jgi:hypothetical protein